MFDQKHMNAAIDRIVKGSKHSGNGNNNAFVARMAAGKAKAAASRVSSNAPPSKPAKSGTHGKVKVERVPDIVHGPGVTVPAASVGPGPGETKKNLQVIAAKPTKMPKPAASGDNPGPITHIAHGTGPTGSGHTVNIHFHGK
jgi:hypothetical protein